MAFPREFMWGAASVSAQIEGGWDEGGRTPSIWDVAAPKRIKNGENCHVSCDHYHRWKEDVALMREIGLKSYRFSISWSRVIPEKGRVNLEGIRFYSDLIDELIASGIEPLVTIYHWDLPVWVQKKGGWQSDVIIPLFAEYTRVVVEAFSDRVTWWMPMNEPQCFIMNGHMQGVHAPFKRDYLALSKMTRICMMAFAASVKAIRQYAKKTPKVGIASASSCFIPADESKESVKKTYHDSFHTGAGLMSNGWWLDPILLGESVTAYGVYHTSKKDLPEIQTKLDFVGINIYSPMNHGDWGGDGTKMAPGAAKTSIGWEVDGRCLYWTVRFFYERYKLPVLVTENGMANLDWVSLDGKVHDSQRTDYLKRYLHELKRAADEGISVLGYQHWSIMDNFEWAEGYDPRFGLIFVDYQTGKRTIKDSAYEYKKIIETNGEII